MSGLFRTTEVKSAKDVAEWLKVQEVLVATSARHLFTEFNPEALGLAGCKFDEEGWTAFNEELAKSMSMETISFRGANLESIQLSDFFNALVENLSVRSVDLGGCGLNVDQAGAIAMSVIPWNKSIIAWDLSDNPGLGQDGVVTVVSALAQAMASVQRISLRNTGVTALGPIIAELSQLTSLVQLDLSENPGFDPAGNKKLLQDLEEQLQRNFSLLNPNSKPDFVSLTPTAPETKEEGGAASSPTRKPRTSMVKQAQRPRGTSMQKKPAATPSQTLPPRREPKAEPKSEKPKEAGSTEASASAPVAKKQPQEDTKRTDSPAKRTDSPAKRTDSPARRTDENKKTDSPVRTRSPAPQKAESPAPQTPRRTQSASRLQPSVSQAHVDDDLEKWKQVKHQYNEYIRSQSPSKPMKIHRDAPKYCLGKKLEATKDQLSPAFRSGFARTAEKAPTPAEIRKLAPWNQKDGEKVPVGAVFRAKTPDGRILNLVNGGDVTCIAEDRRDIGYLARKVAAGLAHPKPTLFLSNTPRELRWGTEEGSGVYMPKKAQAPPVGYYTVESEWEKRAKKYKEQSKVRAAASTGRPCFGGSAAPRAGMAKKSEGPDPGAYDIP